MSTSKFIDNPALDIISKAFSPCYFFFAINQMNAKGSNTCSLKLKTNWGKIQVDKKVAKIITFYMALTHCLPCRP